MKGSVTVTTVAKALDLELKPKFFKEKLDAAESLTPGSGVLELRGYARPGSAGVSADLSARITESLSAFGTAYAGISNVGGNWDPDYGAMAGIRYRW